MTQEEKLLLIDLSSRMPYGVLVEQTWFPTYLADKVQCLKSVQNNNTVTLCWRFDNEFVPIREIKPYLRPMSSMTEEEKREYFDIVQVSNHCAAIDWLNVHHFDYRDLIEKGLALEAPEGMYN